MFIENVLETIIRLTKGKNIIYVPILPIILCELLVVMTYIF